MTDTWVRLPDTTIQAICDSLEGFGWYIEHPDLSYIEVNFPDPDTGHAMRFSGWWLSWREVDGQLAYGVGDDTAGLVWRRSLDVAADATPETVAAAADRAMHLLWHLEDRDLHDSKRAELGQLREMSRQVHLLGFRVFVAPGMLRDLWKRTSP